MRFFLVGSLVLATISLGGAQTLSVPVHPQTHLTDVPETPAVSLPSEQGSFIPAPSSVRSSMPASAAMAPQPSAPASGTILIGAACILLASGGTLRHLLRRESDGFRVAKGQKVKGF